MSESEEESQPPAKPVVVINPDILFAPNYYNRFCGIYPVNLTIQILRTESQRHESSVIYYAWRNIYLTLGGILCKLFLVNPHSDIAAVNL